LSTQAAYDEELAGLLAKLAENVRRLREKEFPDLSQEEVADEATLHRTQWGKVEGGKRDPRFSTLLVMADTLGVTLNDLAAGVPVPKERKPSPPTKRKGRKGPGR
jgi:transcriptional regulator with XRE-family HTH domain